MNIFDFAMQMEKDGKEYYEKLASQSDLPGLKTIFSQLAADEQTHFEIFQQLKAGGTLPQQPESKALETAENIFSQLPAAGQTLKTLGGSLAAYQHGMKVEASSLRFYEEAAEKEENPEIRALLLKVAEEEQKHFNILENIYQFINAPSEYLPGAEVSNVEEIRQFGREVDR